MAVNEALILSVKTDLDTAINQMKTMLAEMRALSSAAKTTKKDMDGVGGSKSPWQSQIKDFKKANPLIMQQAREYENAAKAATKLADAQTKIARISKVDRGGAAAEADKAKNSVNDMNKSLIKTAMLWGAAIYAAKQFGDAVVTGIKFNAMLESANVAFEVMLGSADEAKKLMGDLKALSMYTPIGLEESAKSAKQLVAYGFQANVLVDTMKMLGTVTAATGGGLDDLAYVYGTLRTQGRAYTRDLMQFAMRGIPIYENLAAVLGVNVSKIKSMTEAGKVGFPEVEAAFKRMTSEGGVYFGMLERSMETLTGKANLMGKQFAMSMGVMAKPVEDPLKDMADAVTDFLRTNEPQLQSMGERLGIIFQKAADNLPSLLGMLLDIVDTVITLGDVFTTALTPLLQMVVAVENMAKFFANLPNTMSKLGKTFVDYKKNLTSEDKGTRSSAIQQGMVMSPDEYQGSIDFQKWFNSIFNKDKLNLDDVRAWSVKFGVGVQEVADAALAAGSISQSKWREMTDILTGMIPEFRGVVYKVIADLGGMASSMASKAIAAGRNSDQGQYAVDPWRVLSGKNADVGQLLFDSLETAVRKTVGDDWVATGAPLATFDKAGKLIVDSSQATINSIVEKMKSVQKQVAAYAKNNRTGIQTVRAIMSDKSAGKLTKELYKEDTLVEAYDKAIADIRPRWEKAMQTGRVDLVQGLGTELEKLLTEREELVKKSGKKNDPFNKWLPKELATQATSSGIDDILLDNEKQIDSIIQEYKKWNDAVDGINKEVSLAASLANAAKILQDKLNKEYEAAIAKLKGIKFKRGSFTDKMEQLSIEYEENMQSAADSAEEALKVLEAQMGSANILLDGGSIEAQVRDIEKLKKEAQESLKEWLSDQVQALKAAKFDSKFSIDSIIQSLKASMVDESGELKGNTALANIQFTLKKMDAAGLGIADVLGAISDNLRTVGAGIAAQAQISLAESLQGTEVGNIAAGAISGGPMGALLAVVNEVVAAFMSFLSGLEGVEAVLNPIKAIFDGMASGVGKFLVSILEPLSELLKPLGQLLGPLLAIAGAIIKVFTLVWATVLKMLVPVIKILGQVFAWLYNKIFVPVGNLIIGVFNTLIKIVNGIIDVINSTLGWLGVHIDRIAEISYLPIIDFSENSEDAAAAAKALEESLKSLNEQLGDVLSDTLDYLNKKLRDAADREVATLKDLYEAGAITASQYDAMSKEAMQYIQALEEANVLDSAIALTDPKQIYEEILRLIDIQGQIEAINNSAMTIGEKIDATNAILTQLGTFGGGNTFNPLPGGGAPAPTPAPTPVTPPPQPTTPSVDTAAMAGTRQMLRAAQERWQFFHDNPILDLLGLQRVYWSGEINRLKAALASMGASYAVGTSNIPFDQLATVHKGEGIIPKTFNDAIKNGDYTLSGKKGTNDGGNVIVNVTVNGSVQTEKDLATSVATAIYKQRRLGNITI